MIDFEQILTHHIVQHSFVDSKQAFAFKVYLIHSFLGSSKLFPVQEGLNPSVFHITAMP